jgi:large subunit ribosomal protein L4
MPVMHQAVKAFLANRRQGTAKTKTRGEVTGGNQKPWKQKGTGRARQGSTRAPNWPGGGTVFGPQPRSYTQIVPKQVRALARKSAMNARAREGAVLLVDALNYSAPKTKAITSLLASLGVADKKVLLLTDGVKPNVYLSARNLGRAHVMPFSDASTYHILWSDVVVIESSALTQTSAEG